MSTRAGLAIIAVLILGIVLVAAISGCATKPARPACTSWKAQIFVNEGQVLGVYLDKPNAEKMMVMIEGLANGSCRLPEPGKKL